MTAVVLSAVPNVKDGMQLVITNFKVPLRLTSIYGSSNITVLLPTREVAYCEVADKPVHV